MSMNSGNWKDLGIKVATNVVQKSTLEGSIVAASGAAIASGQPEAMAVGGIVQGLYWLWKAMFDHNKK